MHVVADLYAELRTKDSRLSGINLETDAQAQPIVHVIRGKELVRNYSGAPAFDESQHYMKVLGEIPAEVGSPRRHMIMLFPETYEPGPAPVEWGGSVGRGAHFTTDGGVAMMSAWIFRDEFCATTYAEQ